MQRDRGRSSTDRREAAILRAWRVGNSLAAMRAGKRHAGRTHKSRHMQNEARCISCNSPNELLPRVAYKVHTCGDIVSYVCAPQHAMLHMVFAQSGGAAASYAVYHVGFVYFVNLGVGSAPLHPCPSVSLPRLLHDPCAFFDAPTLPISGILVATR